MGTELLVAGLWAGVGIYWLWSRRPATADTVGLFHRELAVLRETTPSRVPPANRLAPAVPPPRASAALAARAPVPEVRRRRNLDSRRRRRDVLFSLVFFVLLSLLVAALTRSAAAIAVQVAFDLALVAYLWLLAGATNASVPLERRAASGRGSPPARPRQPSPSPPSVQPYGDFESYESLALARAN
jgi:hypothetical protein